jgi:hypothetical protein
MRLTAVLTLVLCGTVLAVYRLWSQEFQSLGLGLRLLISFAPVYALVVFLAALTDFCRRQRPGEGRTVELTLRTFVVTCCLLLLAVFRDWHKERSQAVLLGFAAGALVAALSLLWALGAAEKMARRVAAALDQPAPSPPTADQQEERPG